MKIRKEAIGLLGRIVFSCDPIGKEKDVNNEKFIVQCAERGVDIEFEEFCAGLLDGSEREQKILQLAESLGKTVIDYETIAVYFGGKSHTHKTLADLKRENISENTEFSLFIVFIHLLLPVRIRQISHENKTISAIYENNGISVKIENLLYLPKDEGLLKEGNICLVHYPLVIDPQPERQIVQKLECLQAQDHKFMESCGFFEKKGLDYSKYVYFRMLKKRL